MWISAFIPWHALIIMIFTFEGPAVALTFCCEQPLIFFSLKLQYKDVLWIM
jgi:hypothetical protein